jgi:menaquinone-dependent protoporphyrinogen oxidase
MANIAIIYGTGEGQTEKIADRVERGLERAGHRVALFNGAHLSRSFNVLAYDGVVIGASIHVGKYQPYIVELLRRQAMTLNALHTAFFSVSLSAAGPDELVRAQAERYVRELLAETGWRPDITASLAGALAFSQYSLPKRWFMRLIAKRSLGDLDASVDHEFTDWEAVDRFTEQYCASLVPAVAA